jgi:hypothetical protein
MKFPKLTALVPEGEHFDESAIINEGCYLSIGHINSIESAFIAHDSVVEAANVSATQISSLQEQLTVAQTAASDSAASLENSNTRITALEAEIVALNAKTAADFQETVTSEDRGKELPTGKAKYHTTFDDEAKAYIKK